MTYPYISPRLRPAEGSPRTHARQGDSPAKQLANARKRAKLQELKESARLLEAEVTDNLLSPIDGIHELQMEVLEDRIGQHMEDLGQRIDGKNIENPLTLPPVRKEKVSKAHLAGKNAVDRKTISDKNVGIKQTGKQAERKKIPDKNVGIEKKTVEPVVRTRTSTETRVAKIVQDELRRLLKRKWGNRKQNLVSKAKATSQVQEARSSELRQTGPELEAQVALTAPETPADGEEGTKEKRLGSQQERNDTAYRRELSLQNARHEKEIEDLHREQIIPMQDELRENQNKLAEYYLQAHTTAESTIDRLSLENENLMATIKDHVRSHAARKEFRARERSLSASPSSPSYPSNSRSNSDLSSLKPSLERSPQPPNRSISYSPRPGPKRSDTYTPTSSHGGSPQAKRPSPRPYKPYQPDEPRPKVDSSAFKKVAVAVKKASETWPHASIEVAEQLNSLDNSVVSREERHTIKVFLEVQHQRAMKKNDPWVCPSFDDIGKHFREAAEGTSVNINQKDQILKKQFSMTKAASIVKPRLIRKLDLPMMVLLTGFRNSLSPQFQEVSYYDEKSKPFETLEDLTQHLLKKDAVMNSQKREKSQWDKKATSLYAASGSHKSAGGYQTERVMKLLGPPEEANAKNKKISNAQQLWQMKEGNCPGCHIPYGQCDRPQGKGGSCPHSKPVPEKHMVEAGRVTNEPCPRWGLVQGQSTLVLVDSGASNSFITADLASKAGLHVTNSQDNIQVAGENSMDVTGTAEMRLRIGTYIGTQKVLVVKKLIAGVDLILGEDWLEATEAEDVVMSAKQAVRALRKGSRHFLVSIKKKGDGSINSIEDLLAPMSEESARQETNDQEQGLEPSVTGKGLVFPSDGEHLQEYTNHSSDTSDAKLG
eukprot:gene13684-biopygen22793